MNKPETFEEYVKSFHSEQQVALRRDNAYRYMWNHQQSKIDSQNLLIEKLLEAVEFYGDENGYYLCDLKSKVGDGCGKKAREILNTPMVKDWKGGREG